MNVSQAAIDLIIDQEVGGEKYYNKFLSHPEWPGGASGVTIGIGEDLGYETKSSFKTRFGGFIAADTITSLLPVVGLTGSRARTALSSVKSVSVTWDKANKLFAESTLPKFYDLTMKVYPGLGDLCDDAAGAMVSLVYNRGASLSGSSRTEMKNLVKLVKNKNYAGMAEQFRSMKRLWIGKGLDGLITRRELEAKLIENCI